MRQTRVAFRVLTLGLLLPEQKHFSHRLPGRDRDAANQFHIIKRKVGSKYKRPPAGMPEAFLEVKLR